MDTLAFPAYCAGYPPLRILFEGANPRQGDDSIARLGHKRKHFMSDDVPTLFAKTGAALTVGTILAQSVVPDNVG